MPTASKFYKPWPLIVFSKPLMGCPNLPFFWLSWERGLAKRYTALREMQSFRIKRRAFRLVQPDGGLLVFIHAPTAKTTLQTKAYAVSIDAF